MRRTAWQREREERERQRRAEVPDVVRDPVLAEQQMRFFDQLGPVTRRAIANSRFDDDAVQRWRKQFVGEIGDDEVAAGVLQQDNRRSGSFGPPAPGGI